MTLNRVWGLLNVPCLNKRPLTSEGFVIFLCSTIGLTAEGETAHVACALTSCYTDYYYNYYDYNTGRFAQRAFCTLTEIT